MGGAETAPSRRYYTPLEVGAHNSPDDLWVSFLGGVYDLSGLVATESGVLLQPILDNAGTDISHWFDAKTKDLKRAVDPITNIEGYATHNHSGDHGGASASTQQPACATREHALDLGHERDDRHRALAPGGAATGARPPACWLPHCPHLARFEMGRRRTGQRKRHWEQYSDLLSPPLHCVSAC